MGRFVVTKLLKKAKNVIVDTMQRSAQRCVVIREKSTRILNLTLLQKRVRVDEVLYALLVKDLAVLSSVATNGLTNCVDTNLSAHTNLFVMAIEQLVRLHLLNLTKLNATEVLKSAGEVVVLALSVKNMISKNVS